MCIFHRQQSHQRVDHQFYEDVTKVLIWVLEDRQFIEVRSHLRHLGKSLNSIVYSINGDSRDSNESFPKTKSTIIFTVSHLKWFIWSVDDFQHHINNCIIHTLIRYDLLQKYTRKCQKIPWTKIQNFNIGVNGGFIPKRGTRVAVTKSNNS